MNRFDLNGNPHVSGKRPKANPLVVVVAVAVTIAVIVVGMGTSAMVGFALLNKVFPQVPAASWNEALTLAIGVRLLLFAAALPWRVNVAPSKAKEDR